MLHRALGQSNIQASVVGLGTWAIGGWMWGGSSEKESLRAIHAAIDAGINLIDTAPVYGFGRSEEFVGRAIKDRRDDVVVATKCGLIWDRPEGEYFFTSDRKGRNEQGDIKVHKCLDPRSIRQEVEASLKRLQIDVIDLYQTHWQTTTTPVQETMAELLALKQEGKIRAIGISNASVETLREYQQVGPVDADQEKYNMLDRDQEQVMLPVCQREAIAFLAYSPIAQGLLTGKIGPKRQFEKGDVRAGAARFSQENRQRVQEMLGTFKPLAEARGLTLGQLAIAWTVHQPGCSHALVGARTPQQAKENAAAGAVSLSTDELQTMRHAIDRYHAAG